MDPYFTIRQMTIQDLKLALSWAKQDGWLVSVLDTETVFNADPSGFFIAEYDGEPVASFAAIKHGDYCFWNFYIVKEDFRGKGLGSKLLTHARNYCKDSLVLGLDATGWHIRDYQKYGFKASCQNICYTKKAEGFLHRSLTNLKTIPLDQIVEYDTAVFGYARKKVMELLIAQETNYALGMVEDGRLVGYGVLRKSCGGYYYLGPVSADDGEKAAKLFEGLQSYVPGENVYADVLDANDDVLQIMEKQGWSHVSTFTRMYAKGKPKTDVSRVYVTFDEIS